MTYRRSRTAALTLGLVLCTGCRLDYPSSTALDFECESDRECLEGYSCSDGLCVSDDLTADAGRVDSGSSDAGASDTAGLDAIASDSTLTDSTLPDAPPPDGFLPDAALPDAALPDAALPDASPSDTTTTDAAFHDVALADASAPDGATPDTSPRDLWIDDAYSEIELCDGFDNDRNGEVDEGCDDDGDGYCDDAMTVVGDPEICPNSATDTGDDCDDTVPSCTLDCASNADSDSNPDCLEQYCGSDPGSAASVCNVVHDRTQLNQVIDNINQNQGQGHSYILLQDMPLSDVVTTIATSDGLTIRQVPGATLRIDGAGKDVIKITGADVTFEGVHLAAGAEPAKSWIETSAARTTVRACTFEGWVHRALFAHAASDTLVVNNIFTNGGDGNQDNRASIYVEDSSSTTIVGNVIGGVNAGLHVKGAVDLIFDHNTLADFSERGVWFHSADSSGVCMRSNVVADPDAPIMVFDRTVTWDESAACVGSLDTGAGSDPFYGNSAHVSTQLCAGNCGGDSDSACDPCLPPGRAAFWELLVDPDFATTTLGHTGFYCPQAEDLIDSGDPLASGDPSYDRNGAQTGQYNGAGPDIGGRETGTPECGG